MTVKTRSSSSLIDVQMLDYPSASWKRIFLTQPALREVKMRNLFEHWDDPDMIHCYRYFDSAFQNVEDVDGVRMGQLLITLNHNAKISVPEIRWELAWVEIAVVEESER